VIEAELAARDDGTQIGECHVSIGPRSPPVRSTEGRWLANTRNNGHRSANGTRLKR
jgi:hypothetical protein